ncbi:MAG: hypothetical protein H7Z39_05695, partial [Burkholderiaceae bacterium]|nr:hypothetical protein [Burkholderiaceae bacterium]
MQLETFRLGGEAFHLDTETAALVRRLAAHDPAGALVAARRGRGRTMPDGGRVLVGVSLMDGLSPNPAGAMSMEPNRSVTIEGQTYVLPAAVATICERYEGIAAVLHYVAETGRGVSAAG